MSTQNTPQQGFLLTRHSHDRRSSHNQQLNTEVILWLSTDLGPAKLVIANEQPLFFVEHQQYQQVTNLLAPHSLKYQYQKLSLKTFKQQAIGGLYFDAMHSFYLAKELLQAAHITLYESDLRLQERYLMERFVYGSLEFVGKPTKRPKFIEYSQVKIRPCNYHPNLAILSLDIECSMQGELFSIGLHGVNRGRLYQKVIMIGPIQTGEATTAALIEWVENEVSLLEALQSCF